MLSPEYLWNVADPVVNIWEKLNTAMITDICERLMNAELYDYHQLPGTARYEAWLANQYGVHYDVMVKVIAELTKKSEAEVKRLFEEAGLLTLENDQMIYANHDIPPADIRNNSPLSQMLHEMYTRTNGELKNYTKTTLQQLPDKFYQVMDKAYVAVASGVETYSKAISDAVEELSRDGTQVTYPTGHKDKLDVAVRRAVLTGINQGAAQISLQNALNNGFEYVVVDAHLGARVNDEDKIANHAGWQGKIFKIEGSTPEYGNLKEETGFPENPLGLCGYNCRHSFYPYTLGDPNPFKEAVPDEEENRKAYENSQKQRSMERKIREAKRNLIGLQTCMDNCKDEKTRFELQQEYNKKADRLQKQNKVYREFCTTNGLKTEQERLKAVGWNRERADYARSGAKQYENAGKLGARSVGYGEKVYFDENKSYTVNVPEFSDEINTAVSDAAKKVAEVGSKTRYEYASIIDMDTGLEAYFGTSEDHSGVNSYYNFLRGHKDGKYIMVHNHNIHTGLSLPDIQELEMWENMNVIVSVTNDGYINVAISNGVRTSEYLPFKYMDDKKRLRDMGKNSWEVEREVVQLAAKEFVKGEILEYGEGDNR